MSQENVINELLGLQGVEVMEDGVTIEDDRVVISIVHSPGSPYRCMGCGESYLWAHDHMPSRLIRDFPVWGRRSYLQYAPARVDCPKCGVHVEALDWLEPRARQTLRYERFISILCGLMPALDVSDHEGLDKNLVYTIDRKWLALREASREVKAVKYLGIDEIAVRKGHRYATLFYDLERREVVGGVLGRETKAVNRFFRRWGKECCAQVEAVCTDLWSAYHSSVKHYLKNATLVFDKFHVFTYLSGAIDQVRRDEQNKSLKENGYELIKGTRWLWLKSSSNLKRKQKQTLDEIMSQNKNLHKAYLLKEDFIDFYACQSREEAEHFLKDWALRCKRSGLQPFKDMGKRLLRWKEGILAYFEHRITNAISEGINNKIKVLKRRSYGFHDFQYFLLKIMDATGALPQQNSIPHT